MTHVDARIVSLHVVEPEGPAVVAVVLHVHPRVVRDHVRVNGQNGLGIRPQPGHFVTAQVLDDARELGVSAGGNSPVLQRRNEPGLERLH